MLSKYSGSRHHSYKGGMRYRNPDGYIVLTIYKDNPFYSMHNSQYILEHRLVMAKHFGRCLQSWEVVHHKNGVKDDNRIENLALVNSKEHSPQTLLKLTQARIKELEKDYDYL